MDSRQTVARPASFSGLVFALGLFLTGCSFSASVGLTESAEKIATLAEDALEKSVGSRPEIDCGTESVILEVGKKVQCELTDPQTGQKYDATVEITKVDGSDYSIDVKVADAPKS